jgi:hypothetical protein
MSSQEFSAETKNGDCCGVLYLKALPIKKHSEMFNRPELPTSEHYA